MEAFAEKTAWETEPCLQHTAFILKGSGETVLLWKILLFPMIMVLEANFPVDLKYWNHTVAIWF